MTHVTCRLTSSGTLRSVIEYGLPFFISVLRVTATSTGGEVATLTLVFDDVAGKNSVGVSRSIPGNVDVH